MKRTGLVLIAWMLLTLAASVAGAHPRSPRLDHRQHRQEARIRHGWRSGELTRGERLRLSAGQRHIRRMEWRAKRDGVMTGRERRRLARMQHHESRAIWRLKHNAQGRVL